jgi:hypothetical protein
MKAKVEASPKEKIPAKDPSKITRLKVKITRDMYKLMEFG